MTESDDHSSVPQEGDLIEVTLRMRVRLTDWPALRAAGRAAVEANEWLADDGERDELRADAEEDPRSALMALLDPDVLVDRAAGVELVDAVVGAGLFDDEEDEVPDFGELFPLDEPLFGADEGEWLLTARTARVLHERMRVLGDLARDEAAELGGEPVSPSWQGVVLNALPRVTWRQGRVWRERFAQCFGDLAGDLAGGEWPQPRCPGEEMALHLALAHAQAEVSEDPEFVEDLVEGLPASPLDYDWDGCRDVLFQDTDILMLFDDQLDGVEDPESEINQELRIGDYRPGAWFETFGNMAPRD
jgi:hypothetical protein